MASPRGGAYLAAPGPGGGIEAGYWKDGVAFTIVLIAVVAVRLHELWPSVFLKLRPVLTVSIPGFAYMLARTSPLITRRAVAEKQMRLLLAYFGFILVTIPLSLWPSLAFATAKGLLPAILLFAAFTLVPPKRDVLDKLQLSFVVLVLIFASYGQLYGRSRSGRLLGVGGMYDSNDMASIMALAFPLAAGILIRADKGRPRVAAGLAVVSLVLGVIATGSRGGTLALVAGAIVFAAGLRGPRAIGIVAAMVIGGSLAWSTASPDFQARMMSITNLEDDYNYTDPTGRKAVWARGRSYWRQNPIIGVGAGNFPIAEGGAWSEKGTTGKWSTAHNAYVQAFAELGTIGGGIYVAMLLLAGWQVLPFWRARTRGRSPPWHRPELLAAMAAFAAGAYFLSHAYFNPLFALLGLMTLADRVARAEAAAVPDMATARGPEFVRVAGQRGGFSYARSVAAPSNRSGSF